MHPNPVFRQTDAARSLAFLRARSFGTLLVNADPVPLVAHVPFLLSEDAATADLHLVRSNPIARMAQDTPISVKLAVTGPDSYISPDWYGTPDQVPTWNYVAVHLTGTLHMLDHADLHALLDRQSAHFEAQLAPKPEWRTEKMSDGVMERMMRAIVPMRLHISALDSTWKLGQNKPDTVRQSAARHVKTHGIGTGLADLGEWMDTPPD